MSDRSGILPNSPLVYAIASVRFAQLALLPNKMPEIHEKLRAVAPVLQHVQQQMRVMLPGVVNPPETATQAWLMMSSDRSFGAQLGTEQILFFTLKYQRFAGFHAFVSECLQVLFDEMKFLDVTALGVRYVDHIKASHDDRLADYISTAFLTPTVPSFDSAGGLSQFAYGIEGGQLRVRSIHTTEAFSIPIDLIGLVGTIRGATQPLTLTPLQPNEMLLDIDAFTNYPQPRRIELREIQAGLDNLHKRANAFFRHEAVCTDHAFAVWKGGENVR
ncbi:MULTISPECIES: TIGR04255 family protein [Paraburkholderia]|uniref:TIGR04255 family protein n=1 Tax=Paraburkholderia phenazinium TaxID=60549 RepID=A0A1N6EKK8_9BURK|nr:TIGR04255 family protein [Paraburkholderia phenazinium]SIN83461.1 TIGR04255 family protein [Paraburkholderia phenazinium]